MTRINLIPPRYLADQNLVAEHKEILQLCGSYRKSKHSKNGINFKKLPRRFTLNKGHVKFFYDKFAYLHKRFIYIQNEMRRRRIRTNISMDCNEFQGDGVYKDWEPNENDIEIICGRIEDRIRENPDWYRYGQQKFIETPIFNQFLNRQFNA